MQINLQKLESNIYGLPVDVHCSAKYVDLRLLPNSTLQFCTEFQKVCQKNVVFSFILTEISNSLTYMNW